MVGHRIHTYICITCLTVYTVSMQDLEGLCDSVTLYKWAHDIMHEVIIFIYDGWHSVVFVLRMCKRGMSELK